MLTVPVRAITQFVSSGASSMCVRDHLDNFHWLPYEDMRDARNVVVTGDITWFTVIVNTAILKHDDHKKMYMEIHTALLRHVHRIDLSCSYINIRELKTTCSYIAKRITQMLLCENTRTFCVDGKIYALFIAPMFAYLIEVECPIDFGD